MNHDSSQSTVFARLLNDDDSRRISRRRVLKALGLSTVGAPLSVLGQGRCMRTFGTPACNTTPIAPVFAPTGWKTVSLDHLTFRVAEYQKEAAFYVALMGWKVRSDDGAKAVLDVGDWGSVVFKQAPPESLDPPAAGGSGRGGSARAVVESFCFAIEPWNAKTVEAELRKRGLNPVGEHDGRGFESFHVKDPDGFDLQIGNSNGLTRSRRTRSTAATPSTAAPFEPTGWKTVWLDHLSFGATDYKRSVSFYCNLLGWKETYDEGSQNECLIGDIGDIIIRGGNPLDPSFGTGSERGGAGPRRVGIDHISFGIQPWDTDGVKAQLEKRGLRAQVDTSTGDEIHVAAFKSYHTSTPNGYNLQISYVTKDNRLALPNAVRPKPTVGR
jgi:catechol 2,3-dioxygenase-like lactoylglutathione lyase family enzyme